MATWRDRMAPASFRGVPFHVDGSEFDGGRRSVHHEFPLRDVALVEDMGRKAREFTVEGHVVGDDYMQQRDALIGALEQHGPGELVHPYYGVRRVSVAAFRVRESSVDGGMAQFSISFHETETAAEFVALVRPNGFELVNLAAVAAEQAIRAKAASRSAVSLPSSALGGIASVISNAARALDGSLAPIIGTADEAARVKKQLGDLVLEAGLLAARPVAVLDSVLDVLTAPIPARAGISALLRAFGFRPSEPRPPATTPARRQERALYDVVLEVVRTAIVVEAARLAPAADYDSYEDAVAVRDEIAAALDAQIESADDATFAALEQLRAELVKAVPGIDSDLPRLSAYAPPATVPSLVLAHRLYGNLSREADIIARNRVRHPGFITGGRPLEVLVDA
jgi:prophage DNA circulation protein